MKQFNTAYGLVSQFFKDHKTNRINPKYLLVIVAREQGWHFDPKNISMAANNVLSIISVSNDPADYIKGQGSYKWRKFSSQYECLLYFINHMLNMEIYRELESAIAKDDDDAFIKAFARSPYDSNPDKTAIRTNLRAVLDVYYTNYYKPKNGEVFNQDKSETLDEKRKLIIRIPWTSVLHDSMSNLTITQGFSNTHKAIDITTKSPLIDNIMLKVPIELTDTVIITVQEQEGYGNMVSFIGYYGVSKFTFKYAHLKNFSIDLKPGPIKPGSVVGIMGNTGRSTGVHLHLEMHDAKGIALNPLMYFSENTDEMPQKTTDIQSKIVTDKMSETELKRILLDTPMIEESDIIHWFRKLK